MLRTSVASVEQLARIGDPSQFCAQLLPHVSRTFALGIRLLSGDTYRSMLVGYLVCRTLDTLEDSEGLSEAERAELIRRYAFFVAGDVDPKKLRELRDWQEAVKPLKAQPAEALLLERADVVLAVFGQLPEGYRRAITKPILEMADGMASVLESFSGTQKPFQLASQSDLEFYCYAVAGTVGNMITNVFEMRMASTQKIAHLKAHGALYGHGLQLLNIVKDYEKDLFRGWCYIPKDYFEATKYPQKTPSFQELLEQIRQHLVHGIQYLEGVPYRHVRKRLFCLLPLLLASKNLRLLRASLVEGRSARTKLRRREVYGLTAVAFFAVWNGIFVRLCCRNLLRKVG